MELFAYLFLLLVLAWIGHLVFVCWKAKETVGRSADPVIQLFPEIKNQPISLVMFSSPNCSPCKKMLPLIADLGKETGQTYTIDVTREKETAQAMGIRATPTLLVIKNGQVDKLFLGSKNRSALCKLMADAE